MGKYQATGEFVTTVVEDGVGRLVLNRPQTLNALHPPMMADILQAVTAFAADDGVRTMLIEGAGRAFSAGGDLDFLDEVMTMPPMEIKDDVYEFFAGGIKAIRLFPKPTVAAVNGAATGAGFEIALACDFRVAAEEALFVQTWIKLGLISPLGGMGLLPRVVGLARANEMLLLGTPVKGAEAERIGLANTCVPGDQLADSAMELARRLAAGPPLALRAMKEGIHRGMEQPQMAEWEHNVYVQALLLNSEDYKEGVAALREKRQADFKGA